MLVGVVPDFRLPVQKSVEALQSFWLPRPGNNFLSGRLKEAVYIIDVETIVFSRVAATFTAAYPNGSRYGEQTDAPAKFPCLTLVEDDNATYEKSQDTDLTEHHATIMYTANAYSNKVSGAKQECKAIMALVDAEMQKMGFTRLFCNQTKNADTKIYRMTARYRGIIGTDFRIYRR